MTREHGDGGEAISKEDEVVDREKSEDMMEMLPPGGGIIQNADWVIIGSQTKPYNPPKLEWVKTLV